MRLYSFYNVQFDDNSVIYNYRFNKNLILYANDPIKGVLSTWSLVPTHVVLLIMLSYRKYVLRQRAINYKTNKNNSKLSYSAEELLRPNVIVDDASERQNTMTSVFLIVEVVASGMWFFCKLIILWSSVGILHDFKSGLPKKTRLAPPK